jgi:hypothetical protein
VAALAQRAVEDAVGVDEDVGTVVLVALVDVDPQGVAGVLIDAVVGNLDQSSAASTLVVRAVAATSRDVVYSLSLHHLGSDKDGSARASTQVVLNLNTSAAGFDHWVHNQEEVSGYDEDDASTSSLPVLLDVVAVSSRAGEEVRPFADVGEGVAQEEEVLDDVWANCGVGDYPEAAAGTAWSAVAVVVLDDCSSSQTGVGPARLRSGVDVAGADGDVAVGNHAECHCGDDSLLQYDGVVGDHEEGEAIGAESWSVAGADQLLDIGRYLDYIDALVQAEVPPGQQVGVVDRYYVWTQHYDLVRSHQGAFNARQQVSSRVGTHQQHPSNCDEVADLEALAYYFRGKLPLTFRSLRVVRLAKVMLPPMSESEL